MKTEITPIVVTVSNSFESVLRTTRKGRLLSDLSEELTKAVHAVKEHCDGATLTLTLKIVPMADEAGVSAVSVTDEIKTKLPQPKKPHTLFYTTDDDRLVRDDPSQKELEFRVAEKPAAAEPSTKNA